MLGLVESLLYTKRKILNLNIWANTVWVCWYKYSWVCRYKYLPPQCRLVFSCRSQTILDSCPYLSILALRWYPQQINGHRFEGKEGDYIQIPERLLDVPDAEMAAGKGACALVQFVEYSSQQWFIAGNNLPALKDKVTSHWKRCDILSYFSFTRNA